jgi:Ca2+ transporting ATPase
MLDQREISRYIPFSENIPKLKHFTIIFHTFVFMQIFNEINSRKIGKDEYNVFKDFFNNGQFIIILIMKMTVQILMVEYGSRFLRTIPLSIYEHLICIVIGSFSIIQGLLVKFLIPTTLFKWMVKSSRDV